jgi:hypothetical protein
LYDAISAFCNAISAFCNAISAFCDAISALAMQFKHWQCDFSIGNAILALAMQL